MFPCPMKLPRQLPMVVLIESSSHHGRASLTRPALLGTERSLGGPLAGFQVCSYSEQSEVSLQKPQAAALVRDVIRQRAYVTRISPDRRAFASCLAASLLGSLSIHVVSLVSMPSMVFWMNSLIRALLVAEVRSASDPPYSRPSCLRC